MASASPTASASRKPRRSASRANGSKRRQVASLSDRELEKLIDEVIFRRTSSRPSRTQSHSTAIRSRPQSVDAARLAIEIFELGGRAHVVRGELHELVSRQVAPARVPDEHVDPLAPGALQPRQDPFRQACLVPAVAGQDDIDVGRLLVEDVVARRTITRKPLARALSAIAARRRDRCPRPSRRSHPPSSPRSRTTRSRTRGRTRVGPRPPPGARGDSARSPGRRPTRKPSTAGGVRVVRLDLDGVPERQHLVGKVQADLLQARDRPEARLAKDEGARRGGQPLPDDRAGAVSHHRTPSIAVRRRSFVSTIRTDMAALRNIDDYLATLAEDRRTG